MGCFTVLGPGDDLLAGGSGAVGLFHCNDARAPVHRFCAGSGSMTCALPPQREDDDRPTPLAEGCH
jgi:hypothetical protein